MSRLLEEREKFSIEMAEKSYTIKRLLEDN